MKVRVGHGQAPTGSTPTDSTVTDRIPLATPSRAKQGINDLMMTGTDQKQHGQPNKARAGHNRVGYTGKDRLGGHGKNWTGDDGIERNIQGKSDAG